MKQESLIFVFFILCALGFADDSNKSTFEGLIGFNLGTIIAGEQRDLLENGLSPKPDYISPLTFNAQLAYFPTEYLGIEAGGHIGLVSADSEQAFAPLNCYNIILGYTGINLRWFLDSKDNQDYCILLGGGITSLFLTYNNDFTSLFGTSFSFYKVNPSIGGYAKLAVNYYFLKAFFAAAYIQYAYNRTVIDTTNYSFDGHYLLVGVAIGFAG